MRTRQETKANYKSIFHNGKTLRFAIDSSQPIQELEYPEFYDVSLGSYCRGGCPYCYASASYKGRNYSNVVEKIDKIFGNMSLELRPYQVAIGGGGEPTEHPEIISVLKKFKELEIVPNYTTNGMNLTNEILDATESYSGGVAITLHKHLKRHWEKAIEVFHDRGIRLNIHVVISDVESINYAMDVYDKYKDYVDYFVLLPHMNVGFAAKKPQQIDLQYLLKWLRKVYVNQNIAFGANFYEFLKANDEFDIALYQPEIMSKYLILNDPIQLYNNSFECKKVNLNWFEKTK